MPREASVEADEAMRLISTAPWGPPPPMPRKEEAMGGYSSRRAGPDAAGDQQQGQQQQQSNPLAWSAHVQHVPMVAGRCV